MARSQKPNRFMSPNQQWLAIALVALLVVAAIFLFEVGTGDRLGL